MRHRPLIVSLLAALTLAVTGGEPASTSPGVAVVELFTSEGCSSCPPAEAVLNELAAQRVGGETRLFPLAFHVDYWDYLGWKDAYGDAAYSRRQRKYTDKVDPHRTYTPQMFVNGERGFVGSDRGRAKSEIASALAKGAQARVDLSTRLGAGGAKLTVDYSVANHESAQVLQLAVVERGLVRRIRGGENSGRTLNEENVVRVFRSRPLARAAGELTLDLPRDLDPAKSSLIAYVQDPKTMRITGASAVDGLTKTAD